MVLDGQARLGTAGDETRELGTYDSAWLGTHAGSILSPSVDGVTVLELRLRPGAASAEGYFEA